MNKLGLCIAMIDFPDPYPGVRPWKDRHGKTRWRFRRGEKISYLPGNPGDIEFDKAYRALVAGLPPLAKKRPQAAPVAMLPTAAHPRSLAAAWKRYVATSPEWQACTEETRARQIEIAEKFLNESVVEKGGGLSWGAMPAADLKRRHVKLIIARMSATPHAARHRLSVIRKIILAAMDEEWIDNDPTYRLKYRPKYKGHRAWTWGEMQQFEEYWAVGTTARLVYTLALWFGNRRKDVAAMAPADLDLDAGTVRIKQSKTGKVVVLPLTPDARAVIAKIDMNAPAIVMTAYGEPYSHKSLTEMMRIWTGKAGLPPGCVLHGLRKTLGALIAEGGGTTKQSMAALGHSDIANAELYSRAADESRMAADAMSKVVDLVEARRSKKAAG